MSIESLAKENIDISKIDKTKLINLVKQFSKAKLLVIGDLILDEYLYGSPERISREAPVIILKYLKSDFVLGGAANAANNAAALGAKVKLIGLLGDDEAANTFRNICDKAGINLGAVVDPSITTTSKTRIISSANKDPDSGTVLKQQVLRVDREEIIRLNSQSTTKLINALGNSLSEFDFVLASDYSNGVFSSNLINKLSTSPVKFIVDSNGDLSRFDKAYSLTPNQPDLESYKGSKLDSDDQLINSAYDLKNDLNADQILVTRGAKGMTLISNSNIFSIPAFNLSEVFDVSGAGDTVSATYSIALSLGASALDAALLGNLAASLVVKKYGTATINQEELISLIESL